MRNLEKWPEMLCKREYRWGNPWKGGWGMTAVRFEENARRGLEVLEREKKKKDLEI